MPWPDEDQCPYCYSREPLIRVHGHYQCPDCGTPVITCCEGETGG